jgi:hypothetical protein
MGRTSLILVSMVLAAGCRPGRQGEARRIVPELSMEGVSFHADRGGVATASGEAERVVYRRDTTAVAATGLSMVLMTDSGPVDVTAPAASGVLLDRRFRVEGGVRAVRGTDVATTAGFLSEPGPDGRIRLRGEDPVTVTGIGYRLTGTGFTIDPSTGELAILGQPKLVTGTGSRP